ncbi:recombination protein RecR [Clostridia bacterium]|nr:recombination protein RecR [Clostridia bacterium]
MIGYFPVSLSELTEQFARLPGIGVKSAQRLAYYVLNMPLGEVVTFSEKMLTARKNVRLCGICQNFSDSDVCGVCANPSRDRSIICVVDTPKDVFAFERGRCFIGSYHVLHGLLSPMNGVYPDDLRIKELMARLSGVKELILATPPTIDGEATASYIKKCVAAFEIKVTRLAYGLPVGGSLEYTDDVTLSKALENRVEIK